MARRIPAMRERSGRAASYSTRTGSPGAAEPPVL
jgi:hypothetical protein